MAAYGVSTNDSSIGSYGSASLNSCNPELTLPGNMTPGINNICKDHRGAAEYIVFEDYTGVYGDIVLYLYIVAYSSI